MVGRGTRLHEKKSDLVVIDIVDNSARHKLAGLNALFAWCAAPDGGYRLNLADGEWIGLREDNLGRWCASLHNARDAAMSSSVRFLTIDAGWRAHAPTEKQIGVLRRRGIPVPSGLTRGQASWMITLSDRARPRRS